MQIKQAFLALLLTNPKWKEAVGSRRSYIGMETLILEILGVGDPRTIAYYIGKQKRVWIQDEANKYYVEKKEIGRWVYPRKAVLEWEDGHLQQFGFVTTEIEDGVRMFKIVKGL